MASSGSKYTIEAKDKKFESGDRIGTGSLAHVYSIGSTESEANLVVKILTASAGKDQKIGQKEAELLQRLYSNVSLSTCMQKGGAPLTGIIMPRFNGKILQKTDGTIPEELKDLTFTQRAYLAYQYFDQLDKIHAPKPPHKPAILVDLHAGNIMIDFDTNELYLFDFGEAVLVNSTGLVGKGIHVGENDIARSPETVRDDKIGLVSDIYGSVAPMMLVWGAGNPVQEKLQKIKNRKSIKHDQSFYQELIDVGFTDNGLLEGIKVPTFVVPLDKLIKDLINRMKENGLEQRLQTAAEGKAFFDIVKNIPDRAVESKDISDDDYKKAAKLIAIAAGCGNVFMLSDFDNINECKNLVHSYNDSPVEALDTLRKKYDDYTQKSYVDASKKIIGIIYPNGLPFQTTPQECKEIVSAYKKGNPEALKIRFQLVSLIEELSKFNSNRLISNKDKAAKFSSYRESSREDYSDIDNTLRLFRQLCETTVMRKTKGWSESSEATTGGELIRLLNIEKYAELAHCLSPKEVSFDDLYKFATDGRRSGFFEDFTKLLPSTMDISKLIRPKQ